MKKILTLALLLSISLSASAQKLRVASIISDNMVLQRNSTVNVWGYNNAYSNVSIVGSWNLKDTVTVRTNSLGKWCAQLKTTDAGTGYKIEIFGNGQIQINNVALGEVWLCSGQSNMEWSYNHGGLARQNEEISSATNRNIRIITVPKTGSITPQDDIAATWEVCSSDVMRRTSAISYFFAKKLQEELKVPIGIIVSAWGGTTAEVWTPKDELTGEFQYIADAFTKRNAEAKWWPESIGTLYNAMIYPIKNYTIEGVIWYQGESNVDTFQTYTALQEKMINVWRREFVNDFPFYFVQIAPFNYGPKQNAAGLREAQQEVTKRVKRTEMVLSHDLLKGVTSNIHPANKYDVGYRLANCALGENYKVPNIIYRSPSFKSMTVKDGKAYISFNDINGELKIDGTKLNEIFIASSDNNFISAQAKIEGDQLVVWDKSIKYPSAVRFAYSNSGIGNLMSSNGLPVAPFRTDSF
ncbi:MAG: sialate O-acetylesterase [Rikenellaceae bacterium]